MMSALLGRDDLAARATAFLYREARLADSHGYAEWLSLWATDALYQVPCNEDEADPETHIQIIYERYNGIEDRVRRLSGDWAYAQQPRSRLSRIIANIEVTHGSDGLVEVRSVFNLTAFRRDVMETFAGRQLHRLRLRGEDFELVSKTVFLVNNDGYIGNMTFLI